MFKEVENYKDMVLQNPQDAEEFSEKLASLERKWESRCPGFFKWFN